MALSHSRRALAREEEDRRLHAFLDRATAAEKEAMNNQFLWTLIAAELVQPPDPSNPRATIRQLRKSHPDALGDLARLVRSQAFHRQHKAALQAIYRPVLKRAAGLR